MTLKIVAKLPKFALRRGVGKLSFYLASIAVVYSSRNWLGEEKWYHILPWVEEPWFTLNENSYRVFLLIATAFLGFVFFECLNLIAEKGIKWLFKNKK